MLLKQINQPTKGVKHLIFSKNSRPRIRPASFWLKIYLWCLKVFLWKSSIKNQEKLIFNPYFKNYDTRIRKFEGLLGETFEQVLARLKKANENNFVAQLSEHLNLTTSKLVQFRPGGYLCSWQRQEDGSIQSCDNDNWVKTWKIVKVHERKNNRGRNNNNQSRSNPY